MHLLLDYTLGGRTPGGLDFDRLLRLFDRYQGFVGHDLPNQLVAVQAYARMLHDQCVSALDSDGLALLSRLADLSRQADTRSRRLAEIGRLLRQGEREELVLLDEAVLTAVAAVKATGESSVASFHKGECRGTLRVAPVLLHRVLVELLRNAEAAAARHDPEPAVEIEARSDGGGAEFVVRDNGPGLLAVPPALQSYGGEVESVAGGQGFGLLLAHQAVAAWRGRLEVRSAPYQGCTVTLFVPEREEAATR
jgi:signal transduction histidine kinase